MILEIIHDLERAKKISILPGAFSFNYVGSVLAAGAAGVAAAISIPSDQHFLAQYSMFTAYTAGPVVAVATPPLLVQLTDTGSQRVLFDQPQMIQNVCGGVAAAAGTGNLPFIWPHPWLIRAGGSAQAQVTNPSATTFVTAQLTLFGIRIFALQGSLQDV